MEGTRDCDLSIGGILGNQQHVRSKAPEMPRHMYVSRIIFAHVELGLEIQSEEHFCLGES